MLDHGPFEKEQGVWGCPRTDESSVLVEGNAGQRMAAGYAVCEHGFGHVRTSPTEPYVACDCHRLSMESVDHAAAHGFWLAKSHDFVYAYSSRLPPNGFTQHMEWQAMNRPPHEEASE